jgi:hypothetical protein
MMKRLTSILGYTAAALTIAGAVLIPFLLMDLITRGVAASGVRIDPVFSGGDLLRTIDKGAYRVLVNRPVLRRSPLDRADSFVQMAWTPASALPARIADEIDVDGDGRPDLRATFDVPKNPGAALRVDITPLGPRFQAVSQAGRDSFSRLIARVGDSILVRAPLK